MDIDPIPLRDISRAADSASSGACCGGDCACGHSDTGGAATGAVTAEYRVTGMTCGHCVSSVAEELGQLRGVTGIDVQLDPEGESIVRVASDLPLHRDEVSSAISEAGYSLV